MLDSFEDKGATAICIFAMIGNRLSVPELFIGKIEGTIVAPRGKSEFGW